MNGLLRDVMLDACKKMEGESVPELLFFIILKMMEYHDAACKEGLFAFEEACKKDCNMPELKKIFTFRIGPQIIADGSSEEYVTEVLTARYWANNPQGIDAMANFIVIRAFIALAYESENIRWWYKMQELLTAYLPDGCEERYESYKLKHFPQFVIREKTSKEELMESTYKFDEKDGYLTVVRDKLEKKILAAPVSILEQVVASVCEDWQLSVVIKFTSNEVREKLFSCMTEEKVQELTDFVVCMGPIRSGDVMDAFAYMVLEIMEWESKEHVTKIEDGSQKMEDSKKDE